MKIASLGFSNFEQQLLDRQLKIVTGHTAIDWQYLGEGLHREADVLIAHLTDNAAAASEQLQQLGSSFRGLLAVTSVSAARLEHKAVVEWPLRVFSLLNLLEQAEALQDERLTGQPLCERLTALKEDHWLEVDGWILHVRARQGLVTGYGGSCQLALDYLLASGREAIDQLQPGAPPEQAPVWFCSLAKLVWSLALREGQRVDTGWPAHSSFQLDSYPHFEEWEVQPALLRLSALFTRQAISIEQAASRTSLPPQHIQAFLYACDLCQLGLRRSSSAPPQPEAEAQSGMRGLLGQLRRRLGLAFQ